ncbi:MULTISPECIES: cystathionine gamma-synthase [unclassified Nodularia (in: cyanobacteria)]|uniref:cystathionine gamma-synthase n=1 Tax=unclassified Nodularia (in: cyanobacteria) TaxID=2656917 RepID=UPI00188080C1|nr:MULTISPECIES: cystathionine gamma-synthase [unclassified Nodularia (in: cyanobacteria)]MBE9201173.1 cystathionine gamma-synthase [Nodularia sp. LEGE 06071]MCC2693722.1 cystathionine gamma-synthase [Nodularia sp. LEGE 04288]
MEFETRAIHEGQESDPQTGAVIVPIYLTSTYEQEAIGQHKGYEYSRTGNPTRAALEESLASIENGKFGLAFASGLAATTTVLSLLKSGDRIIAGDDLYGGTYRLLEQVVKNWGVTTTYVDIDQIEDLENSIEPNTKLIWIETPTNPLLKIIDIAALAKTARKHNIILVVDNTFASPYFQTPLDLGADIVVHSTTKYLGGHSDIIGGAVVTSNEELYSQLKFYQNAIGAIPSPFDSWLVLRGIKTLAVRMREHEKNALFLAKFLEKHPKVERIYYPGLPSHPQYQLVKQQMSGFGGMISLELTGGIAEVEKFVALLKLFLLAESLGGVESLLCYPAKMTHGSLPEAERQKRGIKDNLVRLSVGIENKLDLQADLEGALA